MIRQASIEGQTRAEPPQRAQEGAEDEVEVVWAPEDGEEGPKGLEIARPLDFVFLFRVLFGTGRRLKGGGLGGWYVCLFRYPGQIIL